MSLIFWVVGEKTKVIGELKDWWSESPTSHSARWYYGRGSVVNGAKSCILAFSWHQICSLKHLIFLWTFLTRTHKIFKTWRRYIVVEPFRHSLNSDPDTHIIKNNWIIKMYFFSKYTEMMNKSNIANKWENSLTIENIHGTYNIPTIENIH
jgi:hypothetical protein